jgi:hypothetical protein
VTTLMTTPMLTLFMGRRAPDAAIESRETP